MYFDTKVITTDMAKEWLEKNVKNRRLNMFRVDVLVKDMKDGKFTLSPSPICFDHDGYLIDGQHRLSACVLANVPIVSVVAYDVPSDVVIDRGLERTVGDALYMRGIISKDVSSGRAIAVAKRYLIISKGQRISDSELADFINQNEALILEALRVSRIGCGNACLRKAPIQAALLAAMKSGTEVERLESFAYVANSGFAKNDDQSSAIVLRNYLIECPSTGGANANQLCAFSQMAILDFVSGTPRRKRYKNLYFPYIQDAKVKFKEK